MKRTNKKIAKFTLGLLAVVLLTSIVYAVCPPTCGHIEFMSLISSDPAAAYNLDPDKAVQLSFGSVLNNPAIADKHFRKKPDDISNNLYKSYAQKYLASKKEINKNLWRKYLSSAVYDKKDQDLARKYLGKVTSYSNSEDKKVFVVYGLSLTSFSATDKSIAKKFFTANGGKYINDDKDTKQIFTTYLTAEGVDVRGVRGNVKSFSKSGKLSCNNGDINVYDFAKDGAKKKFAFQVAGNGELQLIAKQKDKKKTEEMQKNLRIIGKGWNSLADTLGFDILRADEEKIEERAQKAEVYKDSDMGPIDFKGDLEIDGGTGRLALKKGEISHISVIDASDVEVTKVSLTQKGGDYYSFNGKFREAAGVEFEEPTYLEIVDYTYIDVEDNKIKRSVPLIRGAGKIKKIKPYNNEGYERVRYKEDKEVVDNIHEYEFGASRIRLLGDFDIEDYNNVDLSRVIVVPSKRLYKGIEVNGLSFNDVFINSHDTDLVELVFPKHDMGNFVGENDNFVAFRDEGIIVNGKETDVTINPSALVKHEAALGLHTTLMVFPNRGYFKAGDKGKKGTRSEADIKKIQEVVGAEQNGVYNQETFKKVKEWQTHQQLDGGKISSDGYFGKESLQAYYQNYQGEVGIQTKTSSSRTMITSDEGNIKVIERKKGDTNLHAGKKKSIILTQATAAYEAAVPGITRITELVGLDPNPNKIELTVSLDIVTANNAQYSIIGGDMQDSDAVDRMKMNYAFNPTKLPYTEQQPQSLPGLSAAAVFSQESYAGLLQEFVQTRQLMQTRQLYQSLINGELIKDGVEFSPETKHLVEDDGKLTVLYIAGNVYEKDGDKITTYNRDISPEKQSFIVDDTTTKEFAPIRLKVKPGQDLKVAGQQIDGVDVQITTVHNPDEIKRILVELNPDIVVYSGHSVSRASQKGKLGAGRGYFDPELIGEEIKGNTEVHKKRRIILTKSCVSKARMERGLEKMSPLSTKILTTAQVTTDQLSTGLNVVLSGGTPEKIASVASFREDPDHPYYFVYD